MTNKHDLTYLRLLGSGMRGTVKTDRTGVGTLSQSFLTAEYDLTGGDFPLLTSKKMAWNAIVHELIWFLSGDTNIAYLKENGVSIWDEWADENGDLGPVYGKQWREWETPDGRRVDQILAVEEGIRRDPYSRRHIVTAWNPSDIDKMRLPPCHAFFQFVVEEDRLNLCLYQRSGDLFLGVPFNIASYSLLLLMMAQTTGYKPGKFVHVIGDAHVYQNHVEQAQIQINRGHLSPPSPRVELNKERVSVLKFRREDITLVGYQSLSALKAEVAV